MRGSVRLHFRGFVSGQQLMKPNAPQFDEAELLAPELESKPYKAKKSLMDYEWPDKSPEELEKENQDKTEKLSFKGYWYWRELVLARRFTQNGLKLRAGG